MLAVMAVSIWGFCAVLAGITVGDLFLGSYAPSLSGWQAGACHDS
jgi:hypothetical protein